MSNSLLRKLIVEAIVDTVSENLSDIFNENGKMKPEVRNNIINTIELIKKKFPNFKIIDYFTVGASVTYQYKTNSDIDTSIVVDKSIGDDLFNSVTKYIKSNINKKQYYKDRPFEFVLQRSTRNEIKHADAAYDTLNDKWIKKPLINRSKEMYQAKIGNKSSIENEKYEKFEQLIRPSLIKLYNLLDPKNSMDPYAIKESEIFINKESIEELLKTVYKKYTRFKDIRSTAYKIEPENGYVSQNWGFGNVIYKMLDAEGYTALFDYIKKVIEGELYSDIKARIKLKDLLEPLVNDEYGFEP